MCHAGHHDDHEDDDGAHDDHHHDQEGRCAMLGTEGGPLLRETEMSRDVGEGSSVKPWGSGSANNLVTVFKSFATVGEIRVWWRADFQSGSRVLKKVF